MMKKMKRAITMVLLLTMSLALFACSGSKSDKKEEESGTPLDKMQLVGTWEENVSGAVQTITIKSDGTYHKVAKMDSTKLDYTDTYEIDGDKLILSYEDMGVVFTYKVVFDNDDQMSWYNAGNDELVCTYKRK